MRNDAARDAFRGPEIKLLMPWPMRDLVVSPAYGRVHVGARCGVDARIAPPFMEAPMRVDWCVSSWFRIKNTHSHWDTECLVSLCVSVCRSRVPSSSV